MSQQERVKMILDAKDEWVKRTQVAEARAERYREALERIANHDWTEPPDLMPDEMARVALEDCGP